MDGMRDLANTMDLAELEHRCVQLGRMLSVDLERVGYDFDAETFVVSEIVRKARSNEADVDSIVEMFEAEGFIDRAVARIRD